MPTLTEDQADRYAKAVVDVLADDFPAVRGHLGRAVRNDVAKHATDPSGWCELVVTYTREWRLHPGDVCADRRRVRLVSHKNVMTAGDKALVESVNARLRAIKLED